MSDYSMGWKKIRTIASSHSCIHIKSHTFRRLICLPLIKTNVIGTSTFSFFVLLSLYFILFIKFVICHKRWFLNSNFPFVSQLLTWNLKSFILFKHQVDAIEHDVQNLFKFFHYFFMESCSQREKALLHRFH